MPAPSLDLMRTFLAVHRAGSITAAAHLLGLSQPAVTAQVKTLESTLDRPLFHRHARGVTATAAADELAGRLAAPLDALSRALGEDAPGAPADRVVHLGGPAELTSTRVIPALAGLSITLRYTLGLAEDLLARLAAGELDAVVATVRPRRRGLRVEPLCDEEFVLVAAPRRVVSPDAGSLAHVPLVAYSEDMPIVRRYWRHVFGVAPSGPAAVVVPDLRGVLAAVVAGAGVSVLPRYLCAGELADGSLVQLLDPPEPPINTLYLAARAGGAPLVEVRETLVAAARDW